MTNMRDEADSPPVRISELDLNLLSALAEYRVVTVAQLALVLKRNINSLRRRLPELATRKLIRLNLRRRSVRQGRPEHCVMLSENGLDLLRVSGRGSVPTNVLEAPTLRGPNIEHALLINDLRTQLTLLPLACPSVRVQDLSSLDSSPDRDTGEVTAPMRVAEARAYGREDLVPDAVFALTHQSLAKTLLFFLEADRATEPLQSEARPSRCIAGKIDAYQDWLRAGQYKRYESVVGAGLRGFRLLFLVDRAARWTSMCRLLFDTPSSEFVWVTSRGHLLREGCWAPIWVVDGRITEPAQSILGSQAPDPCPTPAQLIERPKESHLSTRRPAVRVCVDCRGSAVYTDAQ